MRLFNTTPAADMEYESWTSNPRYRDRVVPHVLSHRTEVIYRLTPRDIDEVCRDTSRIRGGHALGDIRKSEGTRIPEVNDWNPPFAFSHVFHHVVESLGRVPTWIEFVLFINRDPIGRAMLGDEQARLIDELAPHRGGRDAVESAIQWRLGNAYYSFLRELHVLANLRATGVDACTHPLADALFRVDAWYGSTVLVLYIGNDEYRNGAAGRKKQAQRILGGALRPFAFESVNLPTSHEFGKVHLPSLSAIEAVAERMLSSTVSS
ncbi:hypothetical protein BG418_09080 [Streptomyces sp. CBMA152]|nr:hypothetical protein [Streptomyces sp. CBMA152]